MKNWTRRLITRRFDYGGKVMDKHIETLGMMESAYAHIRKSDEQFEAIEAAILALQEQAERKKGVPIAILRM